MSYWNMKDYIYFQKIQNELFFLMEQTSKINQVEEDLIKTKSWMENWMILY